MLTYQTIALALLSLSTSVTALPIKREVPQEHSHEPILTAVGTSLNFNNPDGIVDPVFALLGNAAAAAGLGKITDADCLQQATADQAFTNAKAAGDVDGQVNALIYRALERNSGTVGATTNQCTSIQATNPEIAAIQQHQDPASPDAAATNKAIVLALAQQIAAVGGDPQDALKSGTFAPGQIGDPTGAGNACDDANDPNGCINTQNLLVPDATADEINAAVAGGAASAGSPSTGSPSTNSTSNGNTGSASGASSASNGNDSSVATAASTAASSSSTSSSSSGQNLQSFAGALGGAAPPPVTAGGRGFIVQGSDEFVGLAAALSRSCDIQHNACANAANSGTSGLSVGQCDTQDTQCKAAAST